MPGRTPIYIRMYACLVFKDIENGSKRLPQDNRGVMWQPRDQRGLDIESRTIDTLDGEDGVSVKGGVGRGKRRE